jgi:Icc-related predicted phosphoesterase
MPANDQLVRIAAVGDLHFGRTPETSIQGLLRQMSEAADIIVLCGDLTDTGHPDDARRLVKELGAVRVPMVAVLGNHDYELGRTEELQHILCDAGVQVLDGTSCELLGVGFAGTKGFCGGFGRRALGPWGESMIKQFVQEALGEALKLETALGRLRTEHKIAVLHYAPIEDTVVGEPLAIYPFLGSSRLEEPLNRYPVDAVVHGHAHHGTAEGRTGAGVPVFNVSHSLLERLRPEQPPFRLIEVGAKERRPPGILAAG